MNRDKTFLRAHYRRLRASLSFAQREAAHARMLRQVCEHPAFLSPDAALLCFASLPEEPDTWAILSAAWQSGKRTALPRCGSDGVMQFYLVRSADELHESDRGIAEPDADRPLYIPSPADLCIVPGLAFDRDGYRLGYGGGYYDRYLSLHPMHTVGLCYPNGIAFSLPREPFDVSVQQVIC